MSSIEMETVYGKRPLMNELSEGRDLAHQLKNQLLDNTHNSSSSCCESLLQKILSSYDKALSLLINPNDQQTAASTTSLIDEHPRPPADSYSPPHHSHKNVFKKRKSMEKWSEQVKVCSGSMVEGPLSDGYSWRKYGQKDILGSTHPRAYYRCTHRNVQGCLATKQVQRSDEDWSVFEVTYRGRHTCIQATQLSKALETNSKKPKKETEEEAGRLIMCTEPKSTSEEGGCFSFASTPVETEKLESLFYLGGGCSDSTSFMTEQINQHLHSCDSDLSEMINSTPDSPVLGHWGDFSLDHVDFDGNFHFDVADFI